jgi:hypothetical protein
VPAGASLPLRYPMSEKGDDVTMVYTRVSDKGDVCEFSVPVQRAGVMMVEFSPDEFPLPCVPAAAAS